MRNIAQTWSEQHLDGLPGASPYSLPQQRLETVNLRARDPSNTGLCTELSAATNQSVIFI